MASWVHALKVGGAILLIAAGTALLVAELRRAARLRRLRKDYAAAEEAAKAATGDLLRAEQMAAEELQRAQTGRAWRDAAALYMQLRFEMESARERGIAPSREALEAIRANLERVRAGEEAVFPRGRTFLRAYLSAVDGSLQPYGINVPPGYDPADPMRPFPVVVHLHGLSGFRRFQCTQAPAFAGAITVSPQGRGASDYMYLGEDDVLAVIEEVCSLYHVDCDRIVLTGDSMGGTGSWNLAVHYPHLFAGIAPFAGNADHRAWEARWGWNQGAPASHADLRAFLHASLSPVSYAENLASCAVVAVHGTGDDVVPVEHARGMTDRLRELGVPFEYLEFPQSGHGGFPGWAKEFALGRLFAAGPRRTPGEFHYRLANLRHSRAWWLEVTRRDHPARFSEVHAVADRGRLNVETDNVCGVRIRLDDVPETVRPVREVVVDGAVFAVPEGTRALALEKWQGAWRLESWQSDLRKSPRLTGPVSEVLRDPFVLVYGTGGDDALHRRISREEAERFAAEWAMRYGAPPRLKSDSDVTLEELAALHVVLFGGPDVNALSAQLAEALPLRLYGRDVLLGDERLAGEDMGFICSYPNPLAPGRMAVLVAGATPAALYQAFDRFGTWFNWGIYDKYRWFDFAVFDARACGPETIRAVGFFDNAWRLPGDSLSPAGGGALWRADTDALAAAAPQRFPRFVSVEDAHGEVLWLSDLLPEKIEQYRGPVAFDRDYAGGPLRVAMSRQGSDEEDFLESFEQRPLKGLGVKAPSAITWRLEGRFRRFAALAALTLGEKPVLSPARVQAETVVFEVWGDGRRLAASTPLSWRPDGSATAPLEADVSGVDELVLKAVPQGGRTWLYGGAAWAEARVER